MMRYVLVYIVTLLSFLAIDATWLTFVAGGVFKSEVGALLRAEPNGPAAVAFYLLYPIGLVALAIAPAVQARSLAQALWKGALLGLCAYATFDLTNLAILTGWTTRVSLFDTSWGTVCSAVASAIGYGVAGSFRASP